MELKDFIGIYGAILSTVLAIYQIFKDRYKIRIEVEDYLIESSRNIAFTVTVTNVCSKPIEIDEVSLLTNTTKKFRCDASSKLLKQNESYKIKGNIGYLYNNFLTDNNPLIEPSTEIYFTEIFVRDNLDHKYRKKIPIKTFSALKNYRP